MKKREITLKASVAISGRGIFTGTQSTLTIKPSKGGIVFVRTDLEGSPQILARVCSLSKVPGLRCTRLESVDTKSSVSVMTVEHLLAALRGIGIDSAQIEITGPEVPIGDGSSQHFIEAINKVGIQELESFVTVHEIKEPLFYSEGDIQIIALPSNTYKTSYVLHYPDVQVLSSQYFSTEVTKENFEKELANCRTFANYDEIEVLIAKGLIKGGALDNALVIKGDKIINPEGSRFPNEPVRHKVLDLIGDLSLLGPFVGHVIAIRSGHASNAAFARILSDHFEKQELESCVC